MPLWVEQKMSRKTNWRIKNQFLIDTLIFSKCKRRNTNLNMARDVYGRARLMIPHLWLRRTLEVYGVEENMGRLIWNNMQYMRTELTLGKQVPGKVEIKRGIF